eukprot:672492-Prymnesium_polylepis.1
MGDVPLCEIRKTPNQRAATRSSRQARPAVRAMLVSTSVSLRTAILLQLPAVCAAIVLWRRARRVVHAQAEEAPGAGAAPARCSAVAEATAKVSRNIPLRDASLTVVLIIDMQKFCCDMEHGGCWVDHAPSDWDREALPKAVNNIATLLAAARGAAVERPRPQPRLQGVGVQRASRFARRRGAGRHQANRGRDCAAQVLVVGLHLDQPDIQAAQPRLRAAVISRSHPTVATVRAYPIASPQWPAAPHAGYPDRDVPDRLAPHATLRARHDAAASSSAASPTSASTRRCVTHAIWASSSLSSPTAATRTRRRATRAHCATTAATAASCRSPPSSTS